MTASPKEGRITCTRTFEWDAIHRVPEHAGQCKIFHGHRYEAEIECQAPTLSPLGMVIDFGILKEVLGGWIAAHWDHTAILADFDDDPAAAALIASNRRLGKPVYLLSVTPTAENIAAVLAGIAGSLLAPHNVRPVRVTVRESARSSGVWSAG